MREIPLLCNERTVKAIRAGTQTQDRRPIIPRGKQAEWLTPELLNKSPRAKMCHVDKWGLAAQFAHPDAGKRIQMMTGDWIDVGEWSPLTCVKAPWQPGDHLWVRETFFCVTGEPGPVCCTYRADGDRPEYRGLWRPSIHMPKWASRIILEVIRVWVERVQDITPFDCEAEGITGQTLATPVRGQPYEEYCNGDGLVYTSPLDAFAALWDEMYAKKGYGFDANPWVFATEFRGLE